MKDQLKQLLKALCYLLLFFGMQILVSLLLTFALGARYAYNAVADGIDPSLDIFMEGFTEYILDKVTMMSGVAGILTIVFLWIFFSIRKKKFTTEAYIVRFDKNRIIPIVLLALALSVFISTALSLVPIPESVIKSYAESTKGILSGSAPIIIISVVIVAPIVEEVIFRGLILSRLKTVMNTTAALIISSALFAIMHGHILWIAYTFLVGIIFGIVALKNKSIVASIMLHLIFNLVGLYVGRIPFSQNGLIVACLVSFVLSGVLLYHSSYSGSKLIDKEEVLE